MTRNLPKWILAGMLSTALILPSCDDDDDDNGPSYEVPQNYSFASVNDNAAGEQQALTNLSNLAAEISSVEDPANSVTYQELLTIYEDGSPSLSDLTTPGYRNLIANSQDGYLKLLADSSVSDTVFVEGELSGVHSGDSSDFFLADGTEPLQLVEKGLFSAALYNTAAQLLSKSELTAADFDKAFVLFGAPADFPNDGGTNDGFGANYVSDRDNDGTDLYVNVRDGLLEGRAAVEAGDQDAAQAAADQVLENWEKGLGATAIHYAGATILRFQEGERQDGFHTYAEAYGFLGGLSGTTGIISDGEVAELLQELGEPTSVTETELNNFINRAASIYGFDDPTIFY